MTDKITIKHRYTDAMLFEYQPTADQRANGLAMRAALEAATKGGANLRGADLRGADMYGANLHGANLRGADMYGANLHGADLRGADLYVADLRGANMGGANMGGADLREADLRGADMYGANLRGADLRGADMYGANLRGANMGGADLRGANLREANMGDKKLIGERPILMIGPIGSRSDYFTAYITDAGVFLRAGCFFGSVDEFGDKCIQSHGDNEHAQEYAAALELIACHARLWTPKFEVEKAEEVAA